MNILSEEAAIFNPFALSRIFARRSKGVGKKQGLCGEFTLSGVLKYFSLQPDHLPLCKRGIEGDFSVGGDSASVEIPPSPPFAKGGTRRRECFGTNAKRLPFGGCLVIFAMRQPIDLYGDKKYFLSDCRRINGLKIIAKSHSSGYKNHSCLDKLSANGL